MRCTLVDQHNTAQHSQNDFSMTIECPPPNQESGVVPRLTCERGQVPKRHLDCQNTKKRKESEKKKEDNGNCLLIFIVLTDTF